MTTQVLGLEQIEPKPLLSEHAAQDVHPDYYSNIRSFIMVAVCSLTLFLDNGFLLIGISVFDPLMMKRLDVSVGALKAGDTITFATVALAAPLAGYLIDRVGPKPLFVAGMAMMSSGLALYALADSIMAVYAIHALFGLCLVLSGAYACLIVVSEATTRRRGMAIGILLATASLGAALSPTVFSALAQAFGWQRSLVIVAAVTLLALPPIIMFVPRRLHATARIIPGAEQKATLGSSLRSRSFWFLAIVAAVGFLCAIGVTSNMILFLTKDLHLASGDRNMIMVGVFVASLLTQLAGGLLTDILNRRLIHTVCIAAMAVGCGLFATEANALVWPAVILFSAGWGGNYVLLQYLLTHLFSGPSIGRIIGVIGVVEALGGSLGPVLVGGSYDLTKSYSLSFELIAAALLGTAVIASQIRKATERRAVI
jgi:MFS family permease